MHLSLMQEIIMKYLERLAEISANTNLSEDQIVLLRDLTDPYFEKDRDCNVREIRGIISKLVTHERCEDLARLIQDKWTHTESEPNAYEDFTDDVSCS